MIKFAFLKIYIISQVRWTYVSSYVSSLCISQKSSHWIWAIAYYQLLACISCSIEVFLKWLYSYIYSLLYHTFISTFPFLCLSHHITSQAYYFIFLPFLFLLIYLFPSSQSTPNGGRRSYFSHFPFNFSCLNLLSNVHTKPFNYLHQWECLLPIYIY